MSGQAGNSGKMFPKKHKRPTHQSMQSGALVSDQYHPRQRGGPLIASRRSLARLGMDSIFE